MKTKRFCKSTVSLILAVMMLVSMFTVGIVNASAAETDVAETGAVTYYFGFTSWAKFQKVNMQATGKNDDFTALTNCNTTVSHDIGQNVGNNTYNVYSLTVSSAYTTAYVTINNNNTNYETTAITLDPGKITLITEWGGFAKFGQTTYGGGSSSDTFPFTFTEGERTVYLVDKAGWGSAKCYAWKSGTTTSNAGWPGVDMSDTGKTMNGYKIYSYEVASTYDMVIFYNSDANRTGDLTYTQYAYYTNSDNNWTPVGATGGTDDPDDPTSTPTVAPTTPSGEATALTKLYFMDNSPDKFMDDFDADMYASFDGAEKQQMKQRVDTISGKTLWSIDVPTGATSVTVKRYSKLGTEWGSWNISLSDKTSGYYKAVSGSGSWESDESTFSPSSDEDITNFWYGVWVDSKGNGNAHDSVRWWKDSSGYYHIFLPSHTPSTFKLYTSFDSFTVNSKTVTRGNYIEMSNVSFSSYYSMSYVKSGTTTNGRVYFHKTENPANSDYGVSTLLFTTDDQFWTETTDDYLGDVSGYKDAIETKGSIYLYDKDGNLVNDGSGETKLKKIKGRGNSSFEASMDLYGKYAYNFNLDKNVALIDGATKTKKWCLLANNVDHAMLRNTFAYSLAADLGLDFSPKTRPVDVYDNGEYIGSYTITEKVEYGEKSLMNTMRNLDDGNEDANIAYYNNEDIMDDLEDHLIQQESTYVVNGKTYSYQYTTSDDTTNWPYKQPCEELTGDEITDYNYLLEFELHDRYHNEASWFVSPRTKQAVVVKYPEFATQDEMKWIIAEYEAMEKAVYDNDFATYSGLIDVDSFAKVYLIQELALNLDSCATSYYIHNEIASDGTSKLVAGPVWDYDWSFGSYAGNDSYKQKPIFNGSSTVSNGKSMANPSQMFVKVKALKTDNNQSASYINNYNLQAKLAQNSSFWTECKKIWTNDMVDLLNKYVVNKYVTNDTSGIIVDEWLPGIDSSVTMNKIRWSNARMAEEWGTKKTDDYTYGSHSFNYDDRSSSGSSSACYANTVYYLNDWIAARWNYMSSSTGGALYDESLVDPYKLKSITMNATQSGADVTVIVAFDATYNGTQVADADKRFELYVDGNLEGDYAITDTPVVTLTENVETSIHVIAYINGKKDTHSLTSATKKFTYVVTGPEYKVENVSFTAVQSDDKSTVTITPSATVTVEGETVDDNQIEYTVYLNGEAVVTKTFAAGSANVTIPEGQTSEIYISVNPAGVTSVSGTSAKQTFSYGMPTVTATLLFKSSGSLRYAPKVVVNKEEISMTKGALIGKNASQTQSYYWYTADVVLEENVATTIAFKNEYSMYASTTLKLSENKTFRFAVDNLNNGVELVDLTDATENIQNFKLSASHMVNNDPTDPELATTSINGKILKMGDANEDNKFNISDATAIQRSLAEIDTLSETGEALADFNLDGTKSIMDVTYEQIKLAN